MNTIKTHVCMVSAQAAPNLLPLLDETMKPEKVILLVTEPMKQKAAYLEQVIKPLGIRVEHCAFVISDDFDDMQTQIMALLEKEQEAGNVALNVTGGTKWMAIAAQEVFRMNGSPVFYVNVDTDKVLFLDKNSESHKLSQKIKLKNYIEAYGYQFRQQPEPAGATESEKQFYEALISHVHEWQDAIGQLNLLASTAASQNTLSVAINIVQHKDKNLDKLLDECKRCGLLSLKEEKIHFKNTEARDFANGGWLESYVNSALNGLKGEGAIQDKPLLNLHIQLQDNQGSHNEVDVCFMANNRLHLIECKTKKMSGKNTSSVAADTMYKLDSLSELGGLGSKALLVSYRPVNEVEKKRAKNLGIRVIDNQQLPNLKQHLRDWIKR